MLRQFSSTTPVTVFLALTEVCTVAAFLRAGETRHRDLRSVEPDRAPEPFATQ